MDAFVLSELSTTWDTEETADGASKVTGETVAWTGTAEELLADNGYAEDVAEAVETLREGLAAHVDLGGGAATRSRLRRVELADGETLLGVSFGFVYVGLRSGHVESRGRAELGNRTTGFGDRGYWRMSRTLPGFLSRSYLTEAGRTW